MATAVKTVTVTLTLTAEEASLIRRSLFLYPGQAPGSIEEAAEQIRTVISEALTPF